MGFSLGKYFLKRGEMRYGRLCSNGIRMGIKFGFLQPQHFRDTHAPGGTAWNTLVSSKLNLNTIPVLQSNIFSTLNVCRSFNFRALILEDFVFQVILEILVWYSTITMSPLR